MRSGVRNDDLVARFLFLEARQAIVECLDVAAVDGCEEHGHEGKDHQIRDGETYPRPYVIRWEPVENSAECSKQHIETHAEESKARPITHSLNEDWREKHGLQHGADQHPNPDGEAHDDARFCCLVGEYQPEDAAEEREQREHDTEVHGQILHDFACRCPFWVYDLVRHCLLLFLRAKRRDIA